MQFAGPAVIEQDDTTTLVEPGWTGTCCQTAHSPEGAAHEHDPITLEVVRNKLDGIANEMQLTLVRSAFSADREGRPGRVGRAVHPAAAKPWRRRWRCRSISARWCRWSEAHP